jgi:hypothetical protein
METHFNTDMIIDALFEDDEGNNVPVQLRLTEGETSFPDEESISETLQCVFYSSDVVSFGQ